MEQYQLPLKRGEELLYLIGKQGDNLTVQRGIQGHVGLEALLREEPQALGNDITYDPHKNHFWVAPDLLPRTASDGRQVDRTKIPRSGERYLLDGDTGLYEYMRKLEAKELSLHFDSNGILFPVDEGDEVRLCRISPPSLFGDLVDKAKRTYIAGFLSYVTHQERVKLERYKNNSVRNYLRKLGFEQHDIASDKEKASAINTALQNQPDFIGRLKQHSPKTLLDYVNSFQAVVNLSLGAELGHRLSVEFDSIVAESGSEDMPHVDQMRLNAVTRALRDHGYFVRAGNAVIPKTESRADARSFKDVYGTDPAAYRALVDCTSTEKFDALVVRDIVANAARGGLISETGEELDELFTGRRTVTKRPVTIEVDGQEKRKEIETIRYSLNMGRGERTKLGENIVNDLAALVADRMGFSLTGEGKAKPNPYQRAEILVNTVYLASVVTKQVLQSYNQLKLDKTAEEEPDESRRAGLIRSTIGQLEADISELRKSSRKDKDERIANKNEKIEQLLVQEVLAKEGDICLIKGYQTTGFKNITKGVN